MSVKTQTQDMPEVFGKQNITLMLIGIALIVLGMFFMSGGRNSPSQWDVNKVYSNIRITLAPLLVLAGLVLEIVAMFRNKK